MYSYSHYKNNKNTVSVTKSLLSKKCTKQKNETTQATLLSRNIRQMSPAVAQVLECFLNSCTQMSVAAVKLFVCYYFSQIIYICHLDDDNNIFPVNK